MGKITEALTSERSSPPGGWLDGEELGELQSAALHELHRVGGMKAESEASVMAAKRARAAGLPLRPGAEAAASSAAGRMMHYEQRLARLREAVRILQSLPREGCQIIALPDEREAAEQEAEHRAWLEQEAQVLLAARDDAGWPEEAREQLERLSEQHDGVRIEVQAVTSDTARLMLQGYVRLGDGEAARGARFIYEWEVLG